MRICHMTSCHQPKDTRIFLKECVSLADAGHDVFLVVQGEDEDDRGVHIKGCGRKPDSRKERMTAFARIVYERALALDCDVYHFHDPELIPYGLKLKKAGRKVIFDSHEDVPSQIMDKYWIPAPARAAVAAVYRVYETQAVTKFDAVVAATPHIGELFDGRAKRVVVVNNYPRLDDIVFQTGSFEKREAIVCYAGSISESRGERVMVEAMKGVTGSLVLAGRRDEGPNPIIVPANVQYVGSLARDQVNELYSRSRAGIVLYQPAKNHYEAQPIKMFEFMAAGLPIVASDFPLWRTIVNGSGCGVCVDPGDAISVRAACEYFLENPDVGSMMGKSGRIAVENRFNWDNEAGKLMELYERL